MDTNTTPPPAPKKGTAVILILLVLLLVVLVGGGFYLYKSGYLASLLGKKDNKTPQAQQMKVTKTEKAPTELPDKFPKDIPMEAGAEVVQNYNATTEDGRFQATRVFKSKKTIDENLKIYEDYLKANKYTLDPVVSVNNYKAVSGKKLNVQLQVSLDYNTNTKVNTVSINYTEVGKISVPGEGTSVPKATK